MTGRQADLMAEAANALAPLSLNDDRIAGLIEDLNDEIEDFWAGYEPTDTEIYRARGGVLEGEL